MVSQITLSGPLFGMAALTTDLHADLEGREIVGRLLLFSKPAETEQTGKPALLRWRRRDSHLLERKEKSGLPVW